MIDHVPTLETCQQLKEAGFPQETEFRYYIREDDVQVTRPHDVAYSPFLLGYEEVCAAPLMTEVLEQLPATHCNNANLQLMKDKQGGYSAYYHEGKDLIFKRDPENAAEAAALLWLALHDKNLIAP